MLITLNNCWISDNICMATLCVTTLRDWFFQLYYICLAIFETFSFSFISFKLILSIPNVDEICRRIRAGGSATSMALGREYGISCGSSTATVRRTGWTRQLDGAALCAVSSSLQHLASHVSAWPQRSNLKQGPMWDSLDKSNASKLPSPQSRTPCLHRPETSFNTIPPLLLITHRTF